MKNLIRRWLPRSLQDRIRGARIVWNRIRFRGTECFCPICESSIRAYADLEAVWGGFQHLSRGELCPVCYSTSRHRLVWLFLKEKTDLFDGRPKRLLHTAPEYFFAIPLRRTTNLEYISIDLESPYAMRNMDLTDLQFEPSSFDVVLSIGVLEHIIDDRKAMREVFRVLKPGGWALLWVPITADQTIEDASATSPEDRFRLFRQFDHVRQYGKDYQDRLVEAGFEVMVLPFSREVGEDRFKCHGLRRHNDIYFSRKPY